MHKLGWIVIVVAAACGKGDKAKEAPPPEPFKGPLTVANVMAAKGVVKPFQAWDAAFAKLQAELGPPTKIEGKKHFWAAMEGDDCAYVYVEKDDGKEYGKTGEVVGATASPQTVTKDGAIMNRAECLTLVGKGVAAEDPAAEAPRTEGPAYEVSQIQELAVAGRSKWKDKVVRVTGNVTQMMGDTALVRDRVNPDIKLSCEMDAGAAPPPMKGTVVLQGTVETRDFVRGTGEPGIEAQLTKCSLAALDCKAKVAEVNAYFALLKSTGSKGPKPWPTGDDKTDTALRAWIEAFNKKVAKTKAADLGKPMKDETARLLASCAPALAQYKQGLSSNVADRIAVLQSVNDKLVDCDCKVDIPMWVARNYIGLYVASGAALDKPLVY